MTRAPRRLRGATTIEFALVLLMFLMFVFGIVDFSRMLFTWNAATEATRQGARYAVVCDHTGAADQVVQRMRAILPQLTGSNVRLDWVPAACNPGTCHGVRVSITNLNYLWISPIPGFTPLSAITMPAFSTYLPRERMRQDPHSEALCSAP